LQLQEQQIFIIIGKVCDICVNLIWAKGVKELWCLMPLSTIEIIENVINSTYGKKALTVVVGMELEIHHILF
jgi:hypothetical protein